MPINASPEMEGGKTGGDTTPSLRRNVGFQLLRSGSALYSVGVEPEYARIESSATPPQVFGEASASTDTVMEVIVSGESNQMVEERLASCAAWAAQAMKWETV